MTNPKTLFMTTATLAILAGSGAQADVTAQEIWQNFQDFGARYGQRLSGEESFSNGVLTVKNVEMAMTIPEADFSAKIDELILTELSDGTVRIEMSPQMTYDMHVDPAEGEAASIKMLLRQEGLSLIAGGDASNTTYDYVADLLALDIVDFAAEAEPFSMTGTVNMADVTGAYRISDGDVAAGSATTTVASTNYTLSMNDPSEEIKMDMTGAVSDITSAADFTLPDLGDDIEAGNLSAWLAAGLMVKGGYSYGNYDFQMLSDDGYNPGTVQASAGRGELKFELSSDTIDYGGMAEDISLTMSGMQIPLPEVKISMDRTGGRVMIPVGVSDEARDFAVQLELSGLEISEHIWGMFDPTGILPRDPATLLIDTSGKLRWLFDVFDPDIASRLEASGGEPAEVESLDVNQLVLSLIGANLTGGGGFTFDNSDKQSFDGIPKPTGAIELNLKGANGVMDKLVAMGLVPEEQLMGVRMMLGMFARPGAGEDELVSEIRVTDDGQVLANGQRLK